VILAAAVLAAISAGQGRSYQGSGGIAITVIGFGAAVLCALVAVGLARMRRWSRTPALLTQLFTGIIGIDLAQSHRYWWGVPLLALALAGFALLLAPPSLRALAAQPAERA
jgi:predicted membrane protein